MAGWKGQTRGNLLGYRIFIFIIKNLGPRAAYLLLLFVAGYFTLFSGSESRSVYYFQRVRLGRSRTRSLFGIWHTFFLLGQTIIDRIAIMGGLKDKYTYEFDGKENLQEIVNTKKGGLLISAHLGNWDIAANFLQGLKNAGDVYVVMLDAERKSIKNLMESLQKEKNFNVIPVKEDASHVFAINEALHNGSLVCIHADRYIPGQRTQKSDFLGGKALFPVGPFRIALATATPVSFVYAMKETSNHYHLYASSVHYPDNNSTLDKLIGDYVSDLEEKALAYPDQWFNFYDYWIRE